MFQVPMINPKSSLEGNSRIRGRSNVDGRTRHYIEYGFPIGLRDNRSNELISGKIVELLTRSGSHTPFANQIHGVVAGTSQHGQRVLLGRLNDRNRTADRVPANVLGLMPEEVEVI